MSPEQNTFQACLASILETDRAAGLERRLTVTAPAGGLKNFASNDYLGLAAHPAVARAAREHLEKAPVGAGAARLVSGHCPDHAALEEALAAWKGTPRALTFPSGYAAAGGAIPALVGRGDTVILDKLAHACLIDAARLSGAVMRVFTHNDTMALDDLLRETRRRQRGGNILIVVESLYSMDGDTAPLRGLVELKERYGAWLMVDEAHASGVFGPGGRGLCAREGVADRVEIQMGTLGKALGVAGGFIAGPPELVDVLIHRARPFLFSTAVPPVLAAAARRAVEIASGPEGDHLRESLFRKQKQLLAECPRLPDREGPVIPLHTGDEARAVAWSDTLRAKGFLIPAIRYPTVARGEARLRISLSAAHSDEDINLLATTLSDPE